MIKLEVKANTDLVNDDSAIDREEAKQIVADLVREKK